MMSGSARGANDPAPAAREANDPSTAAGKAHPLERTPARDSAAQEAVARAAPGAPNDPALLHTLRGPDGLPVPLPRPMPPELAASEALRMKQKMCARRDWRAVAHWQRQADRLTAAVAGPTLKGM